MYQTLIFFAVIIVLFVLWRFVFFFRNPGRKITYNDNHILAPADGRIIYVKKVTNDAKEPILSIKNRNIIKLSELMHIDDETLLNTTGYLIGIFMSPFNVHYNRAPIGGVIKKIAHDFPNSPLSLRKNLGMFNAISNLFFEEKPYYHDCDYVIENERASFTIKNEKMTVYVTQIGDKLVNKIVTFKENEYVKQGELFGLIRMGSQVDMYVPGCENYELKVKEGQKTRAGLTLLLEKKT